MTEQCKDLKYRELLLLLLLGVQAWRGWGPASQGKVAPSSSGAGNPIVIAIFLIIILPCIKVVLQPQVFNILILHASLSEAIKTWSVIIQVELRKEVGKKGEMLDCDWENSKSPFVTFPDNGKSSFWVHLLNAALQESLSLVPERKRLTFKFVKF